MSCVASRDCFDGVGVIGKCPFVATSVGGTRAGASFRKETLGAGDWMLSRTDRRAGVMSRRLMLRRASLELALPALLRWISRRVVFGMKLPVFRFLVPNYGNIRTFWIGSVQLRVGEINVLAFCMER